MLSQSFSSICTVLQKLFSAWRHQLRRNDYPSYPYGKPRKVKNRQLYLAIFSDMWIKENVSQPCAG
jgi:hypothetical protein